MATSKPQKDEDGASTAKAPASRSVFVLQKNHGLIKQGRASQFFAAGTEFDPAKDGELISALAQSGALIEQK